MKNRAALIAGAFCLLTVGAFAQTTTTVGRTSFGFTAGVNWYNINGKNASGADLSNKLKTGFTGGVNVQIPLGAGTYLQPGVEYTQKGAEWQNGNKVTLGYIDVPVNLLFKPSLGSSNVVVGFGPYIGYGVNGNVKANNGTERSVIFNDEYSLSEAADLQYKRLDAGANVLAGVELSSGLSLTAKGQLGLKNINPDMGIANDQRKYRNTGFGLSLGYRF